MADRILDEISELRISEKNKHKKTDDKICKREARMMEIDIDWVTPNM